MVNLILNTTHNWLTIGVFQLRINENILLVFVTNEQHYKVRNYLAIIQ